MIFDEMKNKISMELRSTDTQQGFEIICKKLSEREKECSIYKNILMDILENQDLCFICRAKGKICQECFCGTTEECADSIYIMYKKENKQ